MSGDDGGADGEDPMIPSAGDRAVARVKAQDDAAVTLADPIYPGSGDRPLGEIEAIELAAAFRSERDARRGEAAAPRSALPGDPSLVADALMMDAEVRMVGLKGADLKAAQRELAEVFVDLQSFRPDEEAVRILADPMGANDELDSLRTARAAIIGLIREDEMSITGNRNAISGLDLRIGDGRVALDAVNRYREKQALALLTMIGIPGLIVIAVIVLVVVLLVRPGF